MKALGKVIKVVLGAICCLICMVGLWGLINTGITMYEKNQHEAPGEYVKVDGNDMHVYATGEGNNTIVLMSGLGTTAPALDFMPLIRELSQNNKVVVVEGFGYGFSDQTKKERTVENIVEELRTALQEAGITAPYTLMPHSISGLYAIYYANKYPEEVSQIIGIDCYLPKMCEYFDEDTPDMPNYMSYIAPLGIARVAVLINPSDYLPECEDETYTKEELTQIKALTAWNGYNKDVVMEAQAIDDNIATTYEMTFPEDLPVLIFTRTTQQVAEDGKTRETFYQTYLDGLTNSKLVVLDGPHYLHWTCSDEMSQIATQWLENQ